MNTNKTTEALEIQAIPLKKAALYFRAINHKLRQQILMLLNREGTLPVTDIYVRLRLEQSVCSQHLAILRKANLVETNREGKQIFYAVNNRQLIQLHTIAGQLLQNC
jgi:DNA-binding transcriptional ArsR family regulator